MQITKAVMLALLAVAFFSAHVSANSALDRADAAVADVLFGYEDSFEYATYSVKESGHVSITFANNIPDQLYGEILTELKNHEDISSVLAGKNGPACSIFNRVMRR